MRRPVLLVGGMAVVTVVAGIAVAASASAGTTTYEAEASVNTLAGGAHAVDCGRCSGGRRITAIGGQGVLAITGVVAEEDGPTRVAVTYTSERARTARISVNGAVPTAIVFPGTRGANRPGTVRITATLRTGENDLTFSNPVGPAPDIDERRTAGCPALTTDDRLTAAARGHSADMAARGYFSHTTPEGVEFSTRITGAGYRWSGAGREHRQGPAHPGRGDDRLAEQRRPPGEHRQLRLQEHRRRRRGRRPGSPGLDPGLRESVPGAVTPAGPGPGQRLLRGSGVCSA